MELPKFEDADKKLNERIMLNALERFVHDNEPADNREALLFRLGLEKAIEFCIKEAAQQQPTSQSAPLQNRCET